MNEKIFNLLEESTKGDELELLFLNDFKERTEDDYSDLTSKEIISKIKELSESKSVDLYVFLLGDIDEIFKEHYEDILRTIDYCKNSYHYRQKPEVYNLKYDAMEFVCFVYRYFLWGWIDVLEDYSLEQE